MRHTLLSLVFLCCIARAQSLGPFPATNSLYFQGATVRTTAEDKLVAIEGKIVNIGSGPQGKPMYEIALSQSIARSVWVSNLMFDKDSQLPVGAMVRVLGYLQRVKSDDSWTKSVTSDAHHVLGFCFMNIDTMKGAYLRNGIEQCEAWQRGRTAEEIER